MSTILGILQGRGFSICHIFVQQGNAEHASPSEDGTNDGFVRRRFLVAASAVPPACPVRGADPVLRLRPRNRHCRRRPRGGRHRRHCRPSRPPSFRRQSPSRSHPLQNAPSHISSPPLSLPSPFRSTASKSTIAAIGSVGFPLSYVAIS